MKDLELTNTGVLTQWNGLDTGNSESNFTAGEKYEYSAKAYIDVDGNPGDIEDFEVDESELNVYVDDYGYALYVEGVEAAKNYAVVIGAGSSNQYGSRTFGATLLMPDGTQKEVVAKYDESPTGPNGSTIKMTGGNGTAAHSATNPNLVTDPVGDLVTYRINKDGQYELTMTGLDATKANATGKYDMLSTTGGNKDNVYFTNGRSLLVIDNNGDANATNGQSFYTTDKTLFFVATDGTGKVVYNVYEGYKNMPSLKTTGNDAVAYVTNSEYTTQIDAVYIAADSLKGMSADATFVVKQFDHNVVTDNTGSYFVMPAIVDNEVTTVKVDAEKYGANGADLDNVGAANATDQKAGVFNITNVFEDKDGIITDADFNAPRNSADFVNGQSYYKTEGLVAANNGVIGLGSDNKTSAIYWAYTDETNFYEVSEDMKTINKVSATSLSTDANDVVYFVADDDATASWKVVQTVIVQKVKDGTVNVETPTVSGDGVTEHVELTIDGATTGKITVYDRKANGTEVGLTAGAIVDAYAKEALMNAGFTVNQSFGSGMSSTFMVTAGNGQSYTFTVDGTPVTAEEVKVVYSTPTAVTINPEKIYVTGDNLSTMVQITHKTSNWGTHTVSVSSSNATVSDFTAVGNVLTFKLTMNAATANQTVTLQWN